MISLAEFIIDKREKAGMSASGLANRAGIDLGLIEDIESGKELFLSVTVRQKLARALKIQPAEIKHYEKLKAEQKEVRAKFKRAILKLLE